MLIKIIITTYPAGVGLFPQRLDSVPEGLQIREEGLVLLQQRLGGVLVLAVVLRVGHGLLLAHPGLGLVGVGEVLLGLEGVFEVLFALWVKEFC